MTPAAVAPPVLCDSSLPTYSVRKKLANGRDLDIMCTRFVDRDFVVVTEMAKLGSLLHVKADVVKRSAHATTPTYDVSLLLGSEDERLEVFAKSIAKAVNEKRNDGGGDRAHRDRKPVLCALALREPDRDLLKLVLDALKECDIWNK